MKPEQPLVVCRTAVPPEPIDPRYTLGYKCFLCGKELQVSYAGVAVIKRKNGIPLCNPCGNTVVSTIAAAKQNATMLMGPDAIAQIEKKTGRPIEQTFPQAESTGLTPEEWIDVQRSGNIS